MVPRDDQPPPSPRCAGRAFERCYPGERRPILNENDTYAAETILRFDDGPPSVSIRAESSDRPAVVRIVAMEFAAVATEPSDHGRIELSAAAACELRGWISVGASAPASTDLIASNPGNVTGNVKRGRGVAWR